MDSANVFYCLKNDKKEITSPKMNMEPENAPFGKETHLQTSNFGVPVNFLGVYIILILNFDACIVGWALSKYITSFFNL